MVAILSYSPRLECMDTFEQDDRNAVVALALLSEEALGRLMVAEFCRINFSGHAGDNWADDPDIIWLDEEIPEAGIT